MRILKKSNSNTKSLAYMSLVRPIIEYVAACWDPYRKGQISGLDRVQKKSDKFAHHKNSPNWETLASRRKLSRICASLQSALWGARVEAYWWQITAATLSEHGRSWKEKIRNRRQRTDIGKYSFINRSIQHWNRLQADMLGILHCITIIFKRG